ncbi:MAG: type II toxin-antitoxin system RelE/ParE family toxin [Bryobacteraceae bacterium]
MAHHLHFQNMAIGRLSAKPPNRRLVGGNPNDIRTIRQWRMIERGGTDRNFGLHETNHRTLDEEEYRQFQTELAANPARVPVMRGGGGIRKVRVSVGSRGKSGGARVIYYWAARRNLIFLLFVLPKNVAANLTAAQTAQLAKIVKKEFGDEAKGA